MEDFIKELENNKEVNIKNNLENRVDIDYVIERLKDIQSNIWYEVYEGEINFVMENIINDEDWYGKDYIDKILKLKDKDIKEIAEYLLDDDELNEVMNNTIEYYLKRKVGE